MAKGTQSALAALGTGQVVKLDSASSLIPVSSWARPNRTRNPRRASSPVAGERLAFRYVKFVAVWEMKQGLHGHRIKKP